MRFYLGEKKKKKHTQLHNVAPLPDTVRLISVFFNAVLLRLTTFLPQLIKRIIA